ncbi:MAG TPA: G5 domain-containing protein [Limnochordia bacterium]|nr:G5 domain-containing protein [Limnochordia bacterium]
MAASEMQAREKPTVSRALVWLLGLVALVVAGLGVYLYTLYAPKEVVVQINDEPPVTIAVSGWTVAHALKAAGIVLEEGDELSPPLTEKIAPGTRITIARGTRVALLVDGQRLELVIPYGTVRDALVRGEVRMGPMDRVVPVRETPLEDGMEIRVIRVTQQEVVERESIPFRTLRWADPHLAKGEERIIREGKEGILETRVLLTYENGELAHRQVIATEVVQEPVAQIIGEGTREAAKVLETATGSYRYVDVLEMEATAYYPGPESTGQWADGYTYTGLKAGKGVVAVDPSVIPLGTRLYVPGYGEAIAADIGGAIKGYRIDLGFDTYEEAIQFGRQKVKVYILAP